jgi:hypothetical protein
MNGLCTFFDARDTRLLGMRRDGSIVGGCILGSSRSNHQSLGLCFRGQNLRTYGAVGTESGLLLRIGSDILRNMGVLIL